MSPLFFLVVSLTALLFLHPVLATPAGPIRNTHRQLKPIVLRSPYLSRFPPLPRSTVRKLEPIFTAARVKAITRHAAIAKGTPGASLFAGLYDANIHSPRDKMDKAVTLCDTSETTAVFPEELADLMAPICRYINSSNCAPSISTIPIDTDFESIMKLIAHIPTLSPSDRLSSAFKIYLDVITRFAIVPVVPEWMLLRTLHAAEAALIPLIQPSIPLPSPPNDAISTLIFAIPALLDPSATRKDKSNIIIILKNTPAVKGLCSWPASYKAYDAIAASYPSTAIYAICDAVHERLPLPPLAYFPVEIPLPTAATAIGSPTRDHSPSSILHDYSPRNYLPFTYPSQARHSLYAKHTLNRLDDTLLYYDFAFHTSSFPTPSSVYSALASPTAIRMVQATIRDYHYLCNLSVFRPSSEATVLPFSHIPSIIGHMILLKDIRLFVLSRDLSPYSTKDNTMRERLNRDIISG